MHLVDIIVTDMLPIDIAPAASDIGNLESLSWLVDAKPWIFELCKELLNYYGKLVADKAVRMILGVKFIAVQKHTHTHIFARIRSW